MINTNFAALAHQGRLPIAALDTAFQGAVGTGEDNGVLIGSPRAAVNASVQAVKRSFAAWNSDLINLLSYAPLGGVPVKGNNIDDDTNAINAIIDETNSRYLAGNPSYACTILIPPCVCKVSGPLHPILGPTVLYAPNGPRSSIFNFVPGSAGSSYDHLTFKGISGASPVSCPNAGINGLQIGSYGITGGNQLALDFCTVALLKNIISVNAFNFCSLRQINTIVMEDILAKNINGTYGIKGFGAETSRTGTARNNAPDWVSLLFTNRVTLIGNHQSGVFAGTPDLILLDGSIQTVDLTNTICLLGKRGVHTTNTLSVPNPLFTSFLWGRNLQLEGFLLEPLRIEVANSVDILQLYAVGSDSACGVYLGPNVNEGRVSGSRVQQNYTHGWDIDGAKQFLIDGVSTWGNSQAGQNVANAINCRNGAKRIRMLGGLAGKRENNPLVVGGTTQYTEFQAYGIYEDGTTAFIAADAADLLGNGLSAKSGNVTIGATCWTA